MIEWHGRTISKRVLSACRICRESILKASLIIRNFSLAILRLAIYYFINLIIVTIFNLNDISLNIILIQNYNAFRLNSICNFETIQIAATRIVHCNRPQNAASHHSIRIITAIHAFFFHRQLRTHDLFICSSWIRRVIAIRRCCAIFHTAGFLQRIRIRDFIKVGQRIVLTRLKCLKSFDCEVACSIRLGLNFRIAYRDCRVRAIFR